MRVLFCLLEARGRPQLPTTSCRQKRPSHSSQGFYYFLFCWFQAFFRLSENETNITHFPPPRHTSACARTQHSRTRAAGLRAVGVGAGTGLAPTIASRARRGREAPPAVSSALRCLAPLFAARCAEGSPGRPRSHGEGQAHPAPARPAQAPAGFRVSVTVSGARVGPAVAPGFCGSGGSWRSRFGSWVLG